MVKSGFFSEEKGLSLVEGLVVFPLVLLTFSAFVEFGFAVHQWNQTVKAAQLGVRLAAVSDPVAADMSPLTEDYPASQGGPPPSAAKSAVCNGYTSTNCAAAELSRLVGRISGFNSQITAANVLIAYHRSGLGYVGQPGGPVVTITLTLSGIPLYLPIMNALLGFNYTVPIFTSTLTSEDLSTSKSGTGLPGLPGL